MTGSALASNRPVGIAVASAIYLVSLAAAHAAGFRMRIPYEFYQLADARLLLEHPFESLWLLHGQPPGLNLLFFVVLWLGDRLGVAPESVATVIFAAVGWGTCLVLYDLAADLAGSRIVGWLAVLVLVAGPGFHVYRNLFFYPFPLELMLLLAAWLSLRWLRRGGTGGLLWVAAALASVCLTRTLYHPAWAVLHFAGLLCLRARIAGAHRKALVRAEARSWAIGSGALLLMLAAWPMKNELVFGRFLYSSWDGLNLHAGVPIPGNEDLESVLRGGAVSPGMQARLEELTRDRSEVGRALLLNTKKSDGSPNWNHLAFLLTDQDLARRSMAWRFEHPGAWMARAVAQYFMWARPPWWQPYTQKDLGPENGAYRAWAWFWEAVPYHDVRPFVERVMPIEAVHREAQVRKKPVPYTLWGAAIFPAVLIAAGWLAFDGWRRRSAVAAAAALAAYCVLWNLAIPAATYGPESNRMRVGVVPLFLLICAWVAGGMWAKRGSFRRFFPRGILGPGGRSMRTVLFALLVPPSFAAAQGRVLVVDDGGGGAYTDIQSAVDESTHGDTVLVWSGTYPGFNVVNKAIAVIADAGEVVQVNGTVQVRNLAVDRDVLLGRLRITGATGGLAYQGTGLYLKNDLGSVRVQGCDLQAAAPHPGALVEGSLDASFNDCRSYGGDGGCLYLSDATAGAGVSVAGSSVAVYFGELRGGAGGMWGCDGCPGASALSSPTSSFLHAAGVVLNPGDGANANDNCVGTNDWNSTCDGGDGGHGVELQLGASFGEVHTFWGFHNAYGGSSGGTAGFGMCGCGLHVSCYGEDGGQGLNIHQGSNDVVQSSTQDSPLLGATPNPVREQATVQLSFLGSPNSTVLLAVSERTGFRPRLGQGVQHVPLNSPSLFQIVGSSNGAGQLQAAWPIPDLGPGVQTRTVYLQPLFIDSSGGYTWGAPVGLVLLDGAF
jgi:hypothetical protein